MIIEKLLDLAENLEVDIDGIGKDEDEMLDIFDECLDDTNEAIDVMGCTCSPSKFLKDNDTIAYRTAFSEWTDSEERDGRFYYAGSKWYTEDDAEELKDRIKDEIDSL